MSAKLNKLLIKVKSNLVLQHDEDDELLLGYIAAAVSYAESYQKKPWEFYSKRGNNMTAATQHAVVMLCCHFYESRDGGTGGFFADNTHAAGQVWQAVHRLLAQSKDWVV